MRTNLIPWPTFKKSLDKVRLLRNKSNPQPSLLLIKKIFLLIKDAVQRLNVGGKDIKSFLRYSPVIFNNIVKDLYKSGDNRIGLRSYFLLSVSRDGVMINRDSWGH